MITFPPGLAFGPETRDRGRSVVATQSFAPGATIARFPGADASNPSISVPDNEHLPRTCHYCLAVPDPPFTYYTRASAADLASLGLLTSNAETTPAPQSSTTTAAVRACTACQTAHYCSRACQKADWALAHGKGECKAFRRVTARFEAEKPPGQGQQQQHRDWKSQALPSNIRALVQALVRPELLAAMADMEAHADKDRTLASGGTRAEIEFQAQAALHYMGREATPQSITEAADIMCKIQVNSFSRGAGDIGQNGFYSGPALAMLNHSCIPNAFVTFEGRDAILHANREIKEGQEIEISYIDHHASRPQRQKSLKMRYYFDCACPRCREDLDVYQVCQRYPHLELNSFSLVPDLNKLRHPPVKQFVNSSPSLQQNIEAIYSTCRAPLPDLNPAETRRELCRRWKLCAQLRNAGLYAVEPLPSVFEDANAYFNYQYNITYSLAVACFLALNVCPYRAHWPFYGFRVMGLLTVAKLLSETISARPHPATGTSLMARISRALGKMDRVTMCQTLLTMALHDWQVLYSKESPVYLQAKDFLNDIEILPGRDTKKALANAFTRNPNGSEERRFFENEILEPIQVLAGFALEVMEAEFGTS
ncbi:SET domain-containing protein [Hypoxylon sp. FL0543]|nr:SET domain-containing protein [Hypoxylon sp. FL0543]